MFGYSSVKRHRLQSNLNKQQTPISGRAVCERPAACSMTRPPWAMALAVSGPIDSVSPREPAGSVPAAGRKSLASSCCAVLLNLASSHVRSSRQNHLPEQRAKSSLVEFVGLFVASMALLRAHFCECCQILSDPPPPAAEPRLYVQHQPRRGRIRSSYRVDLPAGEVGKGLQVTDAGAHDNMPDPAANAGQADFVPWYRGGVPHRKSGTRR